ncbi:hypothetical protein RUM43_013369 [Polyplax serrata]|uniref:Uncharacterized protein n=1 Tax=Polyplax serrata TaxID=468196 RepID=A0AAN8NXS8_POLSC
MPVFLKTYHKAPHVIPPSTQEQQLTPLLFPPHPLVYKLNSRKAFQKSSRRRRGRKKKERKRKIFLLHMMKKNP